MPALRLAAVIAILLASSLAGTARAAIRVQKLGGVWDSVGITADDRGNVYVLGEFLKLVKLTPDGTWSEVPYTPPPEAVNIATRGSRPVWGPDGKLWFGCRPLVCRVDPNGNGLIDTPARYGSPGPDGNFWDVDGTTGMISRTTPSGVITSFPALRALPEGAYASTMVSGQGDTMWFTYGGLLVRVAVSGVVVSYPLPPSVAPGGALAVGSDGDLWISTEKAIAQISPTGQVLGRYPVADTPGSLAEGPDGDVWFTYSAAGGIGRITPSGRVSDFADQMEENDYPIYIVRAADGGMWVNAFRNAVTWRIDPDPPSVATGAPGAVGSTTLNATVNPRGGPTSAYFEYGATASYGARTAAQDLGDGDGGMLVSAPLTGLEPGTAYHYRVVAVNGMRTVYGPDRALTTAAAPVVEPPQPPGVVESASVDVDGDGYPAGVDCDDHAASIHPGAVDRPGDSVDQDCAGGPAPWGHVAPAVDAQWATQRSRTRFTRLALGALPAKVTVTLACHGPGCSSKAYRLRTKAVTKHLNLLARLHGSRLRRGAIVELRLAAAGQATTIIRWRIGPPTRRVTTCLAPHARKEAPCA